MAKISRFLVTLIKQTDPFKNDRYLVVNGQPFWSTLDFVEHYDVDLNGHDETILQVNVIIERCRVNDIPPQRQNRKPGLWYRAEPVAMQSTWCHYTPSSTHANLMSFEARVARLILDPDAGHHLGSVTLESELELASS